MMNKNILFLLGLTAAGFALTAATEVVEEKLQNVAQQAICKEIDGACLKWALSKFLGLAVVGLSFLLKVPIITAMLKQGSADGLTLDSLYLDLISYACSAAYNILIAAPLTTYAETVVIGLQIFIMIVLTWKFNKTGFVHRAIFVILSIAALGAVVILPQQYWPALMAVCTFMAIGSRIAQIMANFKNKHTGVLSMMSVLMQIGGNAVRIFTTMAEVDDIAVLGSYLVSFTLNSTIFAQILFYWSNTAKLNQAKQTSADSTVVKEKVAVQVIEKPTQAQQITQDAPVQRRQKSRKE